MGDVSGSGGVGLIGLPTRCPICGRELINGHCIRCGWGVWKH